MPSAVNLIFPNQLFETSHLLTNKFPVFLVEEYLFFNQYKFHKQKLIFHRSSMRFYETYLHRKKIDVHYIPATDNSSNIRVLIPSLRKKGVRQVHILEPEDQWLEKRIRECCIKTDIELSISQTTLFLNSVSELTNYFKEEKKTFLMADFYAMQRKTRQILVDAEKHPVGGRWSFDDENRKKFPAKKVPPPINYPDADTFYKEALAYVQQNFGDNYGEISDYPLQPFDFKSANRWLDEFLEYRFAEFGPYEDAIVKNESVLYHSKLTPMLNVGLLTPKEIIDKAIDFGRKNKVPINSVEGFIRQILGWREFMRGLYHFRGVKQRTTNYWGFTRRLPRSFYTGATGVLPIDQTIKKVLKTGYCHHIERLMILGNFMLLCEFHPDDVYQWFMEFFIDAYDWVMVPNVYGMSQFADGGIMATKPYISGSNYIRKMSDYPKGEWQETWDALFWRFMHVHRDFFSGNPRIGMLVKNFDKMATPKKDKLIRTAETFLDLLDKG